MSVESRAHIKSVLLESLADCDAATSDVIIKRVYPIVKQLVAKEFETQRNQLMMEVAVTIGAIMRDNSTRKPLWESTPEELGLSVSDLKQVYGRTK